MSRENDNWDDEFDDLQKQLDALKQRVADSERAIEASEKRALLHLRGQQYCRVCGPNLGVEPGKAADPPISKWELMFHDHGHGLARPKDPSRGVDARRAPVTWPELEEQLDYYVSRGAARRSK